MYTHLMNYIGSKKKLLQFLHKGIKETIADDVKNNTAFQNKDVPVFCDLFAGTGVVGTSFKEKGYSVIASDLQYYSYVIARHWIGNSVELPRIPDLVKELNALSGVKGFVAKNYCPQGPEDRRYFTDANGEKIDACRIWIEEKKDSGYISEDESFALLAALLEYADKVANTASVYGAYLKSFKASAQKELEIKPLDLIPSSLPQRVIQGDANEIIKDISGDVLYLDPPYNQRQYSSNYHVLETIALYDSPELRGKTGLRDSGENKSDYCSRGQVLDSFKELITSADFKYIFLSYNSEGLMSFDDIKDVMSEHGTYTQKTTVYNRFKQDNARPNQDRTVTEYLHCLVKD